MNFIKQFLRNKQLVSFINIQKLFELRSSFLKKCFSIIKYIKIQVSYYLIIIITLGKLPISEIASYHFHSSINVNCEEL